MITYAIPGYVTFAAAFAGGFSAGNALVVHSERKFSKGASNPVDVEVRGGSGTFT